MIARSLLTVLTALCLWWSVEAWRQSPFTGFLVERTRDEIAAALDHALARMSAHAVATRIEEALDQGRADDARALLDLALSRDLAIPVGLRAEVEVAEAKASTLRVCAKCALDLRTCPDLTRVAICALPVELTPVGDANAIRRGLDAEPVDRIEIGLGTLGLVATAGIVVTAGSGAAVKSGATLLRVARRAGAIQPGLMDEVGQAARSLVAPERLRPVLRREMPVAEVIDMDAARRLGAIAGDAARIRRSMPLGDALAVTSRARNAADLARLARLSEAAGPRTRGALNAMGTARAMRLTDRIAALALAVLALFTAVLAQIGSLALFLLRAILRSEGRKP